VSTVLEVYEQALAARHYVADDAQRAAAVRLQRLADDFAAFKRSRSNALRKLILRPAVPRGVWLYGGVGRGKSFLMDCFFEAVPVVRKVRLHFHEFMRAVHRELKEVKGRADPLDEVARRIAQRHRLICFDEFHVSDIADAMILGRLMRALFDQGVSFVMTSNYHPDGLYPDGLHRDRILPAIELIKSHVDSLNVDAGVDYRMRALERMKTYHTPLDERAEQAMREAFEALADGEPRDPVLVIEGREVRARACAGGVAWFDFAPLCGGPRSQNDYLELASRFHTVLLSQVPKMSAAMASPARRFVWLVDVFYDQRVKLIISAQCEPQLLYTEGVMASEFHRTVSRIIEMQSAQYLTAARREVAERLT
jgi:cell division protein ZapE